VSAAAALRICGAAIVQTAVAAPSASTFRLSEPTLRLLRVPSMLSSPHRYTCRDFMRGLDELPLA
jgi:hypothetical protein